MTVPYDVIQDVISVLNVISGGKMPTVACDECGLSYNTFCTYTTKYPQLAQMRQEAEDRLYDKMAEALPNIFTQETYEVADAKEAGVVSANIKWLLERRRQKAYGAHSTVEHHITADREVLDALQKAKARAQGSDFTLLEKTEEVLDLTILEGIAQHAPQRSHDLEMSEVDPYDISSLK